MTKKGQTFNSYSKNLKREVVRLKLEDNRQLRERFGIKSNAQL
jgi:transposase